MSTSAKMWSLVPPLVGAAAFGVASLLLGFGWVLSIASALVGAVSGWGYWARSKSQAELASSRFLNGAPKGDLASRLQLRAPHRDELDKRASLLASYAAIVIRGSLYQRAASRVLIAQAAIGAVSIVLFCLAQASGLNIDLLRAPSLVRLLGTNFPMDGSSTIASIRFENLFVPLVLIYGASLTILVVAFLASLRAALGNIGKNWRALVAVPAFVLAPIIMVFHESPVQRSWQKLIIAGDVRGYLAFFVLLPLCMVFLAASLPYDRSR